MWEAEHCIRIIIMQYVRSISNIDYNCSNKNVFKRVLPEDLHFWSFTGQKIFFFFFLAHLLL